MPVTLKKREKQKKCYYNLLLNNEELISKWKEQIYKVVYNINYILKILYKELEEDMIKFSDIINSNKIIPFQKKSFLKITSLFRFR